MYDFLLPKFKVEGVECHLLEVIQENVKAIHLYEKVGLKIERNINSFRGEISLDQIKNEEVVVKKINQIDWELMNSFHDYQPTWDFTNTAIIRNMDDYQSFGVFLNERLVGYAIVKTKDGMIMQFGVDHSYRGNGVGSTLFFYLKNHFSEIRMVNVDESCEHVLKFVKSIGLTNTVNQYEMVSYL